MDGPSRDLLHARTKTGTRWIAHGADAEGEESGPKRVEPSPRGFPIRRPLCRHSPAEWPRPSRTAEYFTRPDQSPARKKVNRRGWVARSR